MGHVQLTVSVWQMLKTHDWSQLPKHYLLLCLSSIPKRSTTEAMKELPFLGQFLGRLCWNPCVTADGECTFWTALTPPVVENSGWIRSRVKWEPFFNLKSCFRTSRQAEAIMMAMRLRSWCVMCYVVLCCLQIQAGGCCSSVCGDCTQSTQPVQWKERLTSGYGYGPDCIFIIVSF